jgi:trigger factor
MTTEDDAVAAEAEATAEAEEGQSAADQTAESATAVAESTPFVLSLGVVIEDTGPCKKHVRITVPRSDIDHIYDEEVGQLVSKAEVPGFRVGHVPRKLVEKRLRKELDDTVKRRLLLDSLEQLSERDDLEPISQPELDIDDLDIPEEGDFEYEFDVEVRPNFDLPDYAGLKIRRPVKETTETDVDAFLERYLSQYGELETCESGAEATDAVSVSMEFTHNGESLHKISSVTVRVRPVLQFSDAELDGFDELMLGVVVGDTREADITVSKEAESIELRGETVHAAFKVLEVSRLKLPEMNSELFNRVGVESEEELRQEIRDMLERQTLYQQRQAVREQVTEKITEAADWDLPESLVLDQVENALRREILEMQQAGFTTQQIQARQNELRQQAVSSTRMALKEHFVLDKIASEEKLEVTPAEIDAEISMMAMQRGESPRRVRARLLKSGMVENLDAQIRERKAVDIILERAEFEDYEPEEVDESRVAAVPHSVCGMAVEVDSDESAAAESQDAPADETND